MFAHGRASIHAQEGVWACRGMWERGRLRMCAATMIKGEYKLASIRKDIKPTSFLLLSDHNCGNKAYLVLVGWLDLNPCRRDGRN